MKTSFRPLALLAAVTAMPGHAVNLPAEPVRTAVTRGSTDSVGRLVESQ